MDGGRLVEFAQSPIRIPSLSCGERGVAERVMDEMRVLAFDEVSMDEYGNVIGVIRGAEAGATLLLDAHTDTVNVGGALTWSREASTDGR